MNDRDDGPTSPHEDSSSRDTSPESERGTPLKDHDGVYIPRDDDSHRDDSSRKTSDSEADPEAQKEDSVDDTSEDPAIDFAGFVTSLGTNCMINVGEVEHPELGETIENLPAARQTIDILKVLQRKTRGNLSQEESNLLKSLIHDAEEAYQQAMEDSDA